MSKNTLKPLIDYWIKEAQASVEENTVKEYPDCPANHKTLSVKEGRKYTKLFVENIHGGEQKSIYAFIENETGNILKPASVNAPAKGARGNVNSVDPTKLTDSTHWLYRR